MKQQCCDKCRDVYFEKDYPMHTAINYCANSSCECHKVLVVAPTEPVEKCYSCGGKGTYSQIHGISAKGDFIGDKDYSESPSIHNYPCKACNGTGLKTTEPVTEDRKIILPVASQEELESAGYLYAIERLGLVNFIRQTRLDLLNEIEGEMNKQKQENQAVSGITMRTEIDNTLVEVFNRGLQVGVDIINKHKK